MSELKSIFVGVPVAGSLYVFSIYLNHKLIQNAFQERYIVLSKVYFSFIRPKRFEVTIH